MAYDSASLNLISPRLGTGDGTTDSGESSALWIYRSADAVGDVDATGYFSDATDKGLQVGDCVIVIDDNTPTVDLCLVTAVSAGAGTVVNLT